LGYLEGENLIIERYSAEGHHERYAELARQIVSRNPDLIVTGTNPVVIVFTGATNTIPVVAFMVEPLIAFGSDHCRNRAVGPCAFPWMRIHRKSMR
jgi:ABC-type uncharacterized transport system substrate-binding protein